MVPDPPLLPLNRKLPVSKSDPTTFVRPLFVITYMNYSDLTDGFLIILPVKNILLLIYR